MFVTIDFINLSIQNLFALPYSLHIKPIFIASTKKLLFSNVFSNFDRVPSFELESIDFCGSVLIGRIFWTQSQEVDKNYTRKQKLLLSSDWKQRNSEKNQWNEPTDAVAGSFSEDAAVERWFPISGFCELCDREQNANGHQNHQGCNWSCSK